MSVDLLIVDDERTVRFGIKKALKRLGLEVAEAENGLEALELLPQLTPAVALMDMNMPGLNGLDTLDRIVAENPDPPLVIMLTAYGSQRLAVEAMKRGAHDYLTKPYEIDELRLVVEKALEKRRLAEENRDLKSKLAQLADDRKPVLGDSEAIRTVWTRLEKAAATDVTVLITGESGTGKELAARAVHDASPRAEKPFVSMNCAAIPEDLIESELFGYTKGAFTGADADRSGRFEQADGGTLFLDEIGDMSLGTQAKVLRALQERSIQRVGSASEQAVDVRVVAATHHDLQRRMEEGAFREDLYYRLKVVEITLPPLRDRREDIPKLAEHFARVVCRHHDLPPKTLSKELLKAMTQAPWRGNVRQLRNQIEAAVVLSDGDVLGLDDFEGLADFAERQGTGGPELPPLDFDLSFREAKRLYVERFERAFLEGALERCDWNVSKAARVLDMHRQSLQQKMRALGIERE